MTLASSEPTPLYIWGAFMKSIALFLVAACLPAIGFAQAEKFSQGRFMDTISALEMTLARVASSDRFYSRSATEQADLMIRGGVRISAFNLQSLGRLYQDYPMAANQGFVKAVREDAKALEDHLGEYDKFKSVGKRKQAEKAAAELVKLIGKSAWLDQGARSPLLQRMKAKLMQLQWLPDAQDRQFVLSRLLVQIEGLRRSRYDMGRLEAGLHELRRELRWFTISVLALDGMVISSPAKVCPQAQPIFARYGDSKYALPTQSKRPEACAISACLGNEMVGTVGLFGKYKDDAEPIVENDPELLKKDRTPPAIAAEAQKAYATLMRSGILDQTQSQLQSCLR